MLKSLIVREDEPQAHSIYTSADCSYWHGVVKSFPIKCVGGSTMLMLQALLPLMLATSGREGWLDTQVQEWRWKEYEGPCLSILLASTQFDIFDSQIPQCCFLKFGLRKLLFGMMAPKKVWKRCRLIDDPSDLFLLAVQGGQWLEMVFKGGTNVCSPPGRSWAM